MGGAARSPLRTRMLNGSEATRAAHGAGSRAPAGPRPAGWAALVEDLAERSPNDPRPGDDLSVSRRLSASVAGAGRHKGGEDELGTRHARMRSRLVNMRGVAPHPAHEGDLGR
jgi:hypothetical protein